MPDSEFIALFGQPRAGRPPKEDDPLGCVTGDPKVTETARRRATRVLRRRYADEFEMLMQQEAEYLLSDVQGSP